MTHAIDNPHTWTDERVDLLRDLLAFGAGTAEIALHMHITRNAVISKATRMGLKLNGTQGRPQTERKPRTRRKPMLDRVVKLPKKERPKLPPEPPPAPGVRSITFMELEPRDCRWPMGGPTDPPLLFCGARAEVGSSYCPYHHDLSVTEFVRRNQQYWHKRAA